MWNGTAATLNASPTTVSSVPTSTTASAGVPVSRLASIWSRNTEPVAPYTSETPISITAVEITETRKNFSAASAERGSPSRRPVIANAGSDTTSSDTTNVIRSREAAIDSAPVAEQRSRKFHSPCGVRPSATEAVLSSATTAVPKSTIDQKTSVKRSTTKEQCTGCSRRSTTQKVARCSPHRRTAATAATTTVVTVRAAGPSAAARGRGGPAIASTRSTTSAPTASTTGAATADQSTDCTTGGIRAARRTRAPRR